MVTHHISVEHVPHPLSAAPASAHAAAHSTTHAAAHSSSHTATHSTAHAHSSHAAAHPSHTCKTRKSLGKQTKRYELIATNIEFTFASQDAIRKTICNHE
jgi:hypothetical protein